MTAMHTDAPLARITPAARGLRLIGIAFAIIGALAVMMPVWATLTAELPVAWMLLLWGALGLSFAVSMRPAQEARHAAILFGVVLALGVIFVLFPVIGIATLTVILMVIFLLEGIVSILLGLRLSGHVPSWGWMIASGAASFAVGLLILLGWPDIRAWALGLLMGLNFLSAGVSLIFLARSFRAVAGR